MLLDLTAAFDTVDHAVLIARLEHCVGITGSALEWFKSYFSSRFSVKFGEYTSSNAVLSCGVPQGFILAPIIFSLYMLPLGSIIRKYGLSFHCYADDTQIYLPLKQNSDGLDNLSACLTEVKAWLSLNFLNFNESKTEIIIFAPSDTPKINLGGLSSAVKQWVKNLGVVFDESLKFDRQINYVMKSCFFQLSLLSKVKTFILFKNFEKVIHAFISSRLDYCNSKRLLRSLKQRLLSIPKSRLKCRGGRAFSVVAPRLWNELPISIRLASSVSVFKSKLKTFLFDKAFNT